MSMAGSTPDGNELSKPSIGRCRGNAECVEGLQVVWRAMRRMCQGTLGIWRETGGGVGTPNDVKSGGRSETMPLALIQSVNAPARETLYAARHVGVS